MLLAIGPVLSAAFWGSFPGVLHVQDTPKPLNAHMHKGQLTCTYLSPSVFENLSHLFSNNPSLTWRTLHWAFAPEPRRAGIWKLKINFSEHYCWLQIPLAFFTCIAIEYILMVLSRWIISVRMGLLQKAAVTWGQVGSRKQDAIC